MSFFKTLLATILGIFISFFLLFILLAGFAASSSSEPEPYIRPNSVLKISLSGMISERAITDPVMLLFDETLQEAVSLEAFRRNLEKAASDDRIAGIWLELNRMATPWSVLQEMHQHLTAFRDSTGKFIYASTTDAGLNEQAYYLATTAHAFFSPPDSYFELDGFYIEAQFFKRLFDKVGIRFDITNSGDFKTAGESFVAEGFSRENRQQIKAILDNSAAEFVRAAAVKTGKTTDEINRLMNAGPLFVAREAHKAGFIDSLMYPDELQAFLKDKTGSSTLQTVAFSRYSKVSDRKAGIQKPTAEGTIAIIHASGEILEQEPTGFGAEQQVVITAKRISDQIDEALKIDDLKAIVVRINSPGGSGNASELIWRTIRNTTQEVPVIASMGAVAASGGYYIAIAADTIVALPTTVTGSIGVIAGKITAKELFEEHIGITIDTIKTHRHADWLSPFREFTTSEKRIFKSFVDDFYDHFLTRVSESRSMDKQDVHKLAQGRVWSGTDARANGLVDVLGGLDEALRIAAEKAEIEHYAVRQFPQPKSIVETLFKSGNTYLRSLVTDMVPFGLGTRLPNESLMPGYGVYAIMPYELTIH